MADSAIESEGCIFVLVGTGESTVDVSQFVGEPTIFIINESSIPIHYSWSTGVAVLPWPPTTVHPGGGAVVAPKRAKKIPRKGDTLYLKASAAGNYVIVEGARSVGARHLKAVS